MAQLRLLADIFNISKEIKGSLREISDMIDPLQYEIVTEAIKRRAGFGKGTDGAFLAPTTAMQSCTLLSKVAEILKCEAIKNSNNDMETRINKFVYLLDKLRNMDITKVALENRTTRQRAKLEVLPTTSEVAHLIQTIKSEFEEAFYEARQSFNLTTYTRLARAILCYIMVFNRKRPGDCHKTLIVEYENLAVVTAEHRNKLPENDKETAHSLGRFVAQGKLNKKASNLIPLQLKEAVDYMLANREKVHVAKDNKYLFANPKAKRLPYFKADQALKLICSKYKINYKTVHANKLRKHLATTTSTLSENLQNIISNFMGHSMGVHTGIYQQRQIHTDIITMGKILRQANGLEQNDTIVTPITDTNALYQKHDLPNSWCDSDDEYDIEGEETEYNESTISGTSQIHHTEDKIKSLTSGTFHEHHSEQSNESTIYNTIEAELSTIIENDDDNSLSDTSYYPPKSINEEEQSSTDDVCELPKKRRRLFKTHLGVRKTWTTPERVQVRDLFKEYIQNLEPPTFQDVHIILSGQPHTLERRADRVQSWVIAEINRKKKLKSRCQIYKNIQLGYIT